MLTLACRFAAPFVATTAASLATRIWHRLGQQPEDYSNAYVVELTARYWLQSVTVNNGTTTIGQDKGLTVCKRQAEQLGVDASKLLESTLRRVDQIYQNAQTALPSSSSVSLMFAHYLHCYRNNKHLETLQLTRAEV